VEGRRRKQGIVRAVPVRTHRTRSSV
jgi:hypothetical protein